MGGNLAFDESAGPEWEQRRRAIEVLCLHQQGDDSITTHRQAIALADFVHDSAGISESTITWSPLAIEALRSQSEQFRVKKMNARPRPRMQTEKTSGPNPNQQGSLSDQARKFFTRFDVNRDGVVSEEEVAGAEHWERFSRFDRDNIAGLSLSELTAWLLITRAEREADKLTPARIKQNFDRIDQNQDGLATAAELGDGWSRLRQWDQDHDDALSLPEFQRHERQNAFVRSLILTIVGSQRPEHPVQLLTLNIALETCPGHITLLNGRAWLQATSDDETIRNGEQAVLDALAACEVVDYRVPTIVDTLAAAYAEVREFDKAIQYAEQAASMSGEIELVEKINHRLKLYKQSRPFRESSEFQIEPNRTSASLRPLFSSEHLATGQTTVLCAAGQRPVCSPVDGTIAFERVLSEDSPQVWLFDPKNNASRKLVDGMIPHWTRDGRLCYVSLLRPGIQLLCIDPEQPDRPIWSQNGIFSTHLWALSPDGKALALGLQSSNEILLLDVSSLDSLWKENSAETPNQP